MVKKSAKSASPLRFFILFFVCFYLFPVAQIMAASPARNAQHELYGFLLRQRKETFDAVLGNPFKTGQRKDGENYFAYNIAGHPNTYFVAIFDNQKAATLELTGTDYCGSTGFFGLKLGDDSSEVEKVIGKPDAITHEEDVNVDLWDYKQQSYSLEFTVDHKLYSIQVVDDGKFNPAEEVGSKDVRSYALAIDKSDIETLMNMSSGELECQDQKVIIFRRKSARAELTDIDGEMGKCLKKAAKEILSRVCNERCRRRDKGLHRRQPRVGHQISCDLFPSRGSIRLGSESVARI
jgi:hypothetical protein